MDEMPDGARIRGGRLAGGTIESAWRPSRGDGVRGGRAAGGSAKCASATSPTSPRRSPDSTHWRDRSDSACATPDQPFAGGCAVAGSAAVAPRCRILADRRRHRFARMVVVERPAQREQRHQDEQPEQRMRALARAVVRKSVLAMPVEFVAGGHGRPALRRRTALHAASCGGVIAAEAQRSALNEIGTCTSPATGCPPRIAGRKRQRLTAWLAARSSARERLLCTRSTSYGVPCGSTCTRSSTVPDSPLRNASGG